jgi:hypothetical protein
MEFRLEPALERRDPGSVITAIALDDDGGRIYVGEEEKRREWFAARWMVPSIEGGPLKKSSSFFSFPLKTRPHRDLRRRARGVEPPLRRRPRRARGAEARRREQKGK